MAVQLREKGRNERVTFKQAHLFPHVCSQVFMQEKHVFKHAHMQLYSQQKQCKGTTTGYLLCTVTYTVLLDGLGATTFIQK